MAGIKSRSILGQTQGFFKLEESLAKRQAPGFEGEETEAQRGKKVVQRVLGPVWPLIPPVSRGPAFSASGSCALWNTALVTFWGTSLGLCPFPATVPLACLGFGYPRKRTFFLALRSPNNDYIWNDWGAGDMATDD